MASHVAAVAGTAAELGVEAVKKRIADKVLEGALSRADRNPTFHAFSVSARDHVRRRGEQVGSTVKNMIDFFEGHRRRTGVDDNQDKLLSHAVRPDQHSVAECQSFVAGRTALPSVATKIDDHDQDQDSSSHRPLDTDPTERTTRAEYDVWGDPSLRHYVLTS